ncbi:unnamed protein product [Rotaria sp. Silwood2]|nr:unnamed protein product [Rotaria sp. Silwood2]CAF4488530.1 unnamed protein product [Rotaria sp. Silwood2]
MDAIELAKNSLSDIYLTSYNNELINECVLIFDVSDLDSFLHIFDLYWKIFPNNNEIHNLSCDDIDAIMITNIDYEGFIKICTKSITIHNS